MGIEPLLNFMKVSCSASTLYDLLIGTDGRIRTHISLIRIQRLSPVELQPHCLLHNLWRKARESNSKGIISPPRFSRPLPSPIGLAFHYSFWLPHPDVSYRHTGSRLTYSFISIRLVSRIFDYCLRRLTTSKMPPASRSSQVEGIDTKLGTYQPLLTPFVMD